VRGVLGWLGVHIGEVVMAAQCCDSAAAANIEAVTSEGAHGTSSPNAIPQQRAPEGKNNGYASRGTC